MAKRKKQLDFTFQVFPGEIMTEEQVDEAARIFAEMVVRDLHRTNLKEPNDQPPSKDENAKQAGMPRPKAPGE